MFVICHFKDDENKFILYDKKDLKEVAEQMNIEIEKEITLEDLKKEYSHYTLIEVNDLIIRIMNHRTKTATNKLNTLGISSLDDIEKEYNKIQEKNSYLSRSERDLIVKQYEYIFSL